MPTKEIYDEYIKDIIILKNKVKNRTKGLQSKTANALIQEFQALDEKYQGQNFGSTERVKYFKQGAGSQLPQAEELINFDMAFDGVQDAANMTETFTGLGYFKDTQQSTQTPTLTETGTEAQPKPPPKGSPRKFPMSPAVREARNVIPKGRVDEERERRERLELSRRDATTEEERQRIDEAIKAIDEMEKSDSELQKRLDETKAETKEANKTEAGTGAGNDDKEEEKEDEKTETQTPNVSMSVNRVELPRSKEEKEMKEKKKADFIPRERLAVEGKTLDELRDDIKYFLKEFKPQLKEEATIFKRVKTLDDMQRLHRRIIGKLQPDEEPKEEKRRMVEVDMERYIDERVQRLIMENMMNSVKPQAVMIDVEGQAQKKTKDVGSYELKQNKGGKMFAKREPIYRAIPSTNPDDIEEQFDPYGKPAKVLKGAPTKKRTLATTAKRQFMQSPFRRPMQTIDLKYIA